MKYALIELLDNFEKGCCQDCPLSYTEWFDDDGYTDCRDVCVLNSRFDECPLEIRSLDVLDQIRAEIEKKIEREEFARSVFRYEEKNIAKAEQCTSSISVYNSVIRLIDKYKTESEK
jgi:hypothetical protein